MVAGALPTTEKIAVPSYTPTSVPAAEGDRMIIVYIGTQSVVVYKAVDGEWTEERADDLLDRTQQGFDPARKLQPRSPVPV